MGKSRAHLIIFLILLAVFYNLVPHAFWERFGNEVRAQGFFVPLVLLFSIVAVSLLWAVGQRLDELVFRLVNTRGYRAPLLDRIMLLFTQMGHYVFALLVAGVVFLLGNRLLAYDLVLGILTLGLIVQIMKVTFHRIRPYTKLKNIRIVGSREPGQSFPSGHTSQAFFLATLLVHYYHLSAYPLTFVYILALLVGVTRIYVGMHYPRDVIAGALIGSGWGLVGMIVNNVI